MGGMSRRKGVVGELEVVHELDRMGILARRTAQRMGSSGDASDVIVEGAVVHLEVKRTQTLAWKATIAQASRDAKGKPWVILHRTNGGKWMAIVPMDQWVADSEIMQRARSHRWQIMEAASGLQA